MLWMIMECIFQFIYSILHLNGPEYISFIVISYPLDCPVFHGSERAYELIDIVSNSV